MGERRAMQEALFYGFGLERHVPDNHLLRKIDRFVDLSEVRTHLEPYYSPSIDAELMMRMLIVGYCFRLDDEAAVRQSRGPRIDRRNPSTRSRTTAHPRLRNPSERPSGGVGQANPAGPKAGSSPSPRESVAR